MSAFSFPYQEIAHPLFGIVRRPLIRVEWYAEHVGLWVAINNVLADTGADLSVVPLPLGELLVPQVDQGTPIQLGGIVSSPSAFTAFVHQVRVRIAQTEWEMPLAVARSATIPPIFGRHEALDRFVARFVNGEELILET